MTALDDEGEELTDIVVVVAVMRGRK